MNNGLAPNTQYVGVKTVRGRKKLPFQANKIPPKAHRVVQRMFAEMNAQQCSQEEMARRSGVSRNTLKDWKHRSVPRLDMIEACLNVLGYELHIREKDRGAA